MLRFSVLLLCGCTNFSKWTDFANSRRLDKRRLFLMDVGDALVESLIYELVERQLQTVGLIILAEQCHGWEWKHPQRVRESEAECWECARQCERKTANKCKKCGHFVRGEYSLKHVFSCVTCPVHAGANGFRHAVTPKAPSIFNAALKIMVVVSIDVPYNGLVAPCWCKGKQACCVAFTSIGSHHVNLNLYSWVVH